MEKHKRVYRHSEETAKRFEIFKKNLKYVIERNSKEVRRHTLGMNRFADMSNEEFKEKHLSKIKKRPPFNMKDGDLRRSMQEKKAATSCEAPSSLDWRKKGVVTAVKDQGDRGSCWVFSSIGAMEGINAIATGDLVSLSEQELVSSHITKVGDYAFEWVISNGGIHSEADYPCINSTDYGPYNTTTKEETKVVTIDGYQDCDQTDSSLMCATINQPISVGIDGSALDFQLYTSGIYAVDCSNDPNDIDHAVLIVGYGSKDGEDYWICKNSWGTSWGMEGYFYIKRNTNLTYGECAINAMASYPTKGSSSQSPFSSPAPKQSHHASLAPAQSPFTSGAPVKAPARSPYASPVRSPHASPTPARSPYASPVRSPHASPTPARSPYASPVRSPHASPVPVRSPYASSVRSPHASPNPKQSPNASPSPALSPRASLAPARSPHASPAPVRSPHASPAPVRSPHASPAPERSPNPSPALARSPYASLTPARSPYAFPSPARSPHASPAPTRSPYASPARSPRASLAPTRSPCTSPATSPERSPHPSPALARSPYASLTPARSPYAFPTPARSPHAFPAPTRSPYASPARSPRAFLAPTRSPRTSPARSPHAFLSPTRSPYASPTPIQSPNTSPARSRYASSATTRSPHASPIPTQSPNKPPVVILRLSEWKKKESFAIR